MLCAHNPLPSEDRRPGLDQLIEKYMAVVPHRAEILFHTFLPKGYGLTTLNSVPTDLKETAILAKIHLGMIITLYDDLADHPQHRRPDLLKKLYRLNVREDKRISSSVSQDGHIIELARHLFRRLTSLLFFLPNCKFLMDVLKFDIEQFYNCNRLSTLTGLCPEIVNLSESRILGPHNMGIVAAGTIDLMASRKFVPSELGVCREAFLVAQRMGRISNILFTYDREIAEGDLTNEMLIGQKLNLVSHKTYQELLQKELRQCHLSICNFKLNSFSVANYADSFLALHRLHSDLKGRI